MHFYVKNFRVFNLQSNAILYSIYSSSVIKDKNINNLLNWLLHFSGKLISHQKILQKIEEYSLEKEKTVNYLQNHLQLITACKKPSADFTDSILIYSTDSRAKYILLDELTDCFTIPVLELTENIDIPLKSPLTIAFFENFMDQQISDLYKKFQNIQASFITSYVMHRTITIDGLFVPFKGTPCHFCFLNRWINLEMSKKKIANASWYNYFNYVRNSTENLSLSLPIVLSDIGILVATLKKKLRWLMGGEVLPTCYDPRAFTRYHLDSGHWDHDVVPHWPGCQCITESWQ